MPLLAQAALPCAPASEAEIAGLFERWNDALRSGDAAQVAATYRTDAVLLPTLSNQVRVTPEQRLDYFRHFVGDRPSGRIVSRSIQTGCDSALDAGIYEFTFAATGKTVLARYSYTYRRDGDGWLISSHHSSLMPEAL